MAEPCPHHQLTLGGLLRSLPYTSLGLLFGLSSLAYPTFHGGLLLFRGHRGFARLFLARRGFVAATFGRVVITTQQALPVQTLVHERHHAYQYERLGLLFLPVYFFWQARRGYARNPLELEAVRCVQRWQADGGGVEYEPSPV